MSPLERRAAASLAGLYGLRMLGMFLILPVFALYAEGLPGGDSLALVGLALGVYGLTQALLQLPFGMASDRLGRKRVIYFGLVLFALGSFVAAGAEDVYTVIVGRTLQGAGAINAAVTALLADLTREEQRTKAMALVGGTIGLTFALSLVLGPALYHAISVPGIFALTGVLALLAIPMMKFVVPDPQASRFHSDAEVAPASLRRVLRDPELARLNFGIFALHAVQMALFLSLPFILRDTGDIGANRHWQVYLPVLAISVVIMLPFIWYGQNREKPIFIGAVALLLAMQVAFIPALDHFWAVVTVLTFYFVAFNLLEANLPALVSKLAPADAKGTALGVYNTAQSLGVFAGGALAGLLAARFGAAAVFGFGAVLVGVWLLLALFMRRPPAVRNLIFPVPVLNPRDAHDLERRLAGVVGVTEVVVLPEERAAYLKVDSTLLDETALRRLLPTAGV